MQAELAVQFEELRSSRRELEAAHRESSRLFDLGPERLGALLG